RRERSQSASVRARAARAPAGLAARRTEVRVILRRRMVARHCGDCRLRPRFECKARYHGPPRTRPNPLAQRSHMPLGGILLFVVLALTVAGVVASSAAALRFEEGDCREGGPGGTWVCPSGTVGIAYSAQLRGAAGCGP